MYALTIFLGSSSFRMLYKTQEKAEANENFLVVDAGGALKEATLTDDFGQKATIKAAQLAGWLLEDLEQSKLGAQEFALHQARVQASLQQRAESDPTLRAARMGHSPAIINPVGNGRFS